MINTVAVYLGSSLGSLSIYGETAYKLGRLLGERKISVVYGGASVGTMELLAKGVTSVGGEIIGVFPKGFKGKKEVADNGIEIIRDGLSKMILADDLRHRIELMNEMSDACIILPGSFGTMNEFFEYLIGRQLGMYDKPICVLNINGYYDPIKQLISNMIFGGFMPEKDGEIVQFANSIEDINFL